MHVDRITEISYRVSMIMNARHLEIAILILGLNSIVMVAQRGNGQMHKPIMHGPMYVLSHVNCIPHSAWIKVLLYIMMH